MVIPMFMTADSSDRKRRVDQAIDRIRTEFEEVVDESQEATRDARTEVREAVDELEDRIRALRERENE